MEDPTQEVESLLGDAGEYGRHERFVGTRRQRDLDGDPGDAALGQDRLWPARRWPTLPFELDGPLAVGARGGHGPIRYAVEEYEPGRRVVFRFHPALGIVGTHTFRVEPIAPTEARLTHVLDCGVRPNMLARWPIVRRYHDAVIEDALDQAELATTGRLRQPRRPPTWLRIANGVEMRLARRRDRSSPAATVAPPSEGRPHGC